MVAQTGRFEFRVAPDAKAAIEQAASLTGESASDFVRRAAVERAQAVLQEDRGTVVPSDYFDALMAELDAPAAPNERTRAAAARLSEVVRRDG